MTIEEAVLALKRYQGYEPMEYGNILKHSFDLTDETVDTLLSAIRTEPAGEPLTLEQLREMDGQKVLLYRMKSTEPLEPGTVKQNGDVLGDAGMLAYHELYLETWVAFTYPPAHIDMEAWVSVEEKLPDAEEEVRLCCMTASGYRYQCQGFYVPPGTHRDDSGYSWDWECCEEYDEERDDYLVNPGWYESIHNWDEYSACGIVDRVIYWMPLPETPGELEKRLRG